MINQQASQTSEIAGQRFTLNTRGRFILLIALFNLVLLIIVLLSISNQEIKYDIERVQTIIVRNATRLAIIQKQSTKVVFVTQTFTSQPTATPLPTSTFTPTLLPSDTPTFTPVPPTSTPTELPTPTPTVTATPTPEDTETLTPTATHTPLPTPTFTLTPTPVPPTDTPTPSPTLPAPSLLSITPNSGGNESLVSVSLGGSNFQGGATVLLRRAGYSDIVAINVNVVSASQITCQLNLAGAVPGPWDVIVINPDSQSSTLVGGFTVNSELHHFGFAPIGNQTVGIPFAVTITAYDRYNNLVSDFAGTANLSDTTGTVSPTLTGNFAVGVWTGNLIIAQAQAGVTITATSGGRSGMSNSFDVAHQAPNVTSIVPNTGLNTTTTPVTISGNGFFATPTARLGFVALQNVTFVNATTLTATVPAGIAAGIYDLYVTNPGPPDPTGVLTNAFTVQNASIPSTTLETSFLATFGISPTAGTNGDNDSVQVIFFEVPDTLTDTLYVRIFDPEVGGGGALDIDEEQPPGPMGAFDTSTTFSLYGGGGAYTAPAARQAIFATTADPGIITGTLLASQTFTQNAALDQRWLTLATFNPNQGEHVGSKYVFKLSVVGGFGDDGNIYNVVLSTSDTLNTTPAGSRAFAYSWTFQMGASQRVPLYPYVGAATTTFTQNNFDFDYPSQPVGITITTPIQSFSAAAGGLSGDAVAAFSSYAVSANEQSSTWTVLCFNMAALFANDSTFWATNQGGTPLPIFTRSSNQPAP